MKKILIIAPHYPPSNLAAVHRSRLFAQHLPSFGWEPIVLTVDEKYYEEALDWNLHQLLPPNQRIEKVSAFNVTKPRLIGDIGLRAFFQLRARALEIIKHEAIDFVYIPIPSFYVSLIGPYLHRKTGVKYGIDYIDPWVHQFPGSEKLFSRHWWSKKLAHWLEPKAVKNASVITGVAEGYFKGVVDRNPKLKRSCVFGAMPYGGEAEDHRKLRETNIKPYLFGKSDKVQLVYAGAMLPKAYQVLTAVFSSISRNREDFKQVEFHFIGTGKSPNDDQAYNIRDMAKKYGLWQTTVFEYPKRIPYLDVLIHLNIADAVFILGSTEPHYTPSKTYQAVLSKKPILAVLHKESTAVKVLRNTNAGMVIDFLGEDGVEGLETEFSETFCTFSGFVKNFKTDSVDFSAFDKFSAKAVTRDLVNLIEFAITRTGNE